MKPGIHGIPWKHWIVIIALSCLLWAFILALIFWSASKL